MSMRIVCVDDDPKALDSAVSLCRALGEEVEVEGFVSPKEALAYLKENVCDIAILDIKMPEMDGLKLAEKIKTVHPETSIIFLTNHPEYALDAYKLHVAGYIQKPLEAGRLREDVDYALSTRYRQIAAFDKNRNPHVPHIRVHTFGEFDVYVDGEPVKFARAKAKELLAHLVDRQGGVSRPEIFATLWEDGLYDRPAQKQLDVIIRSLRGTLDEYGISEMLDMQGGIIRIMPDRFECDLYKFLEGDMDTINSYRGEYLSEYSWASLTEAYMDRLNSRD